MDMIHVIGLGMGPADLTSAHKDLIHSCDVLVGGNRHLGLFPQFKGETIPITRDIPGVVQTIKLRMIDKKIVVLASGDPMFHGIGTTLAKELPPGHLQIHPNISCIAAAFSALQLSWDDAFIVSLHRERGRNFDFRSLEGRPKVAFLTSPHHTPRDIIRELQKNCSTRYKVCILECLGDSDRQKITWCTRYEELPERQFHDPNVVVLLDDESIEPGPTPLVSHETYPGMPDDSFRSRKGLITKAEIRVLSLMKLKLSRPDLVAWDIGSGSGSVGIEVARLIPEGFVHAVEKNSDRIQDIQENIKRFGCDNIEINALNFPEGYETLKQPDRVFIGGGGNDLKEIIIKSCQRLNAGGIIVVNAVVLENMNTAFKTMSDLKMSPEMLQVQINKSVPIGPGHRLEPLNPVWILTGTKSS